MSAAAHLPPAFGGPYLAGEPDDFCDMCGRIISVSETRFGYADGYHDHVLCDECGRRLWAKIAGEPL